jgi:hypothetical protein
MKSTWQHTTITASVTVLCPAEHTERQGIASEIVPNDHEWNVSKRERDGRGRFK